MKLLFITLGIILGSMVLWFIFGIIVPVELLGQHTIESVKDNDTLVRLSQLGDAFGGANALFSSLALFLLMLSVWFQQKELEATRKELKVSADAQKEMAVMERKALALQVIMPFMDEISSQEMRNSIIFLSDLERQQPDFANVYSDLLAKRKSNSLSIEETEQLEKIDSARRRFVMVFHRMYKLKQTEVVTEDIIKVVIGADHVNLLLKVVEPLEAAIRSNYARDIFELAEGLYDSQTIAVKGTHQ